MPDVLVPKPTGLMPRLSGAWSYLTGRGAPPAQPVGTDPVAQATPVEETAQPKVEEQPYSRVPGGLFVDPAWLNQLAINDDKVLTREGQHDLKLYDAILDDPTCASAFQQRRLAVVSKPWEVEAGDESAQAQAAADHLRDQLKAVPWDRICDRMLFGLWYGYAVGEAMFGVGPDGKIWLTNVLVPDRAWFGFTNAGELRLKSAENQQEVLPPNKFWTIRSGATHDFALYGVGLAHFCYWSVWFKKNAIKFWAIYLEKFGMPTAVAKYREGAGADEQKQALAVADAVGRSAAVAIPLGSELDLMAQGRTSDATYEEFCKAQDDNILRVILSQTGTSKSEAQGLGGSQSDVMKGVRDEVVAADSDLLHETFNQTIAKWLTLWNFGPDVAPPRVYRNLEPEDLLTKTAELDQKIKNLGYRRTEESFRETYGEGYERNPDPVLDPKTGMPVAPGQPGNPQRPGQPSAPPPPGNDNEDEDRKKTAEFAAYAASGPRSLYVSRKLLPASAKALLSWAAGQGIPNLFPADELHVTVLYSKTPVDWFAMGDAWSGEKLRVVPGGPRLVEKFGDDDSCVVLRFASQELTWRHEAMVRDGASHDFDGYSPHVTLTNDGADFSLEGVEPYQGALEFGPEIFEPIKGEDWGGDSTEFSAQELDAIDRWAAKLATEAEPMVAEFAASLKGKLEGVTTSEGLRLVLLEAVEQFPAERLGELTGLSFAAARAAAAAGETDQLAV